MWKFSPLTDSRFSQQRVYGWLACVALTTGVLYWRRPDAFYNPQLWAEDGSRFFTEAFGWGAKTFFLPYAGYFHLMARGVAWIGIWLPTQYTPHWYYFAAWLLLIIIITYIFSARFEFTLWQRFGLGLALVVNAADNEVFFNIANWATLGTLFWLLLANAPEPQTQRQTVFELVLLGVTGLNSPFVICLWLLFLWRWRLRRTAHSRNLFVLSLLIAALQIWHMPTRLARDSGEVAWSLQHLDAVLYRFGYIFLGEQIYQVPPTTGWRVAGIMGVVAFYGILFGHFVRRKNWPGATLLSGGLLTTALSLFVMRHLPQELLYSAGRHFYLGALTTLWALLLADLPPLLSRSALSLAVSAFLFFTPAAKWQTLPDLHWADHVAQCVGMRPICPIPINPVLNPPTWFALMSSHIYVPPTTLTPFQAQFGEDTLELLGYEMPPPTSTLTLVLVWRAGQGISQNYSFFVHLFDPRQPTQILAQTEQVPLEGSYPTSYWWAHEIISTSVQLPLTNLQPGMYHLGVGWYAPLSPQLERLLATSDTHPWADNRVILPITLTLPTIP